MMGLVEVVVDILVVVVGDSSMFLLERRGLLSVLTLLCEALHCRHGEDIKQAQGCDMLCAVFAKRTNVSVSRN